MCKLTVIRVDKNRRRVVREKLSFIPIKLYCCLAIISLFLPGNNIQAELKLIPQWAPDLSLWSVDVAYNADTQTLLASGPVSGQVFVDAENNMFVFDEWGAFNLSAAIDNAGVASSGSFSLTGEVLGYGTTGPLLTGNNLSVFNSLFVDTQNSDGDEADFEFVFDVSGGDMADLYGGVGAKVYIIMTFINVAGDAAQKQFTTSFDNLYGHPFGEGWGNAMADIHPICMFALTGDLNNDCTVDFYDFALFATKWLSEECGEPERCGGADFNLSGDVTPIDFAELAQNWLIDCQANPSNPSCVPK